MIGKYKVGSENLLVDKILRMSDIGTLINKVPKINHQILEDILLDYPLQRLVIIVDKNGNWEIIEGDYIFDVLHYIKGQYSFYSSSLEIEDKKFNELPYPKRRSLLEKQIMAYFIHSPTPEQYAKIKEKEI